MNLAMASRGHREHEARAVDVALKDIQIGRPAPGVERGVHAFFAGQPGQGVGGNVAGAQSRTPNDALPRSGRTVDRTPVAIRAVDLKPGAGIGPACVGSAIVFSGTRLVSVSVLVIGPRETSVFSITGQSIWTPLFGPEPGT